MIKLSHTNIHLLKKNTILFRPSDKAIITIKDFNITTGKGTFVYQAVNGYIDDNYHGYSMIGLCDQDWFFKESAGHPLTKIFK